MEILGTVALTPVAEGPLAAAQVPAAPREGKDTPKIALSMGDGGSFGGGGRGGAGGGAAASTPPDRLAGPRRIKQLGVDHVLGGLSGSPWTEPSLNAILERFKAVDITVGNLMINLSSDILYGRPGNKRDEDIEKVKLSIIAAGKTGLPVIEYNFYAHRAMEGYFEETGRAGLGHTGFDYEKMKGLPPLPEEGAHSLDEMWNHMTYFLKAVIPVAEESGVRMALHPNDPPAPISRGSGQIMGTVAGWKKLISIVDSPSNGITFDCGVAREMGEDPVEVCRYFGSRDRINHMHYRNVHVMKPYERYTEVAFDEGQVDMFGVMRELVRQKYTRTIYPEHPRMFDYDREYNKLQGGGRSGGYPGGGGYTGTVFNVAYARAMMQAVYASM